MPDGTAQDYPKDWIEGCKDARMQIQCKYEKLVCLDDLKPHPENTNTHPPEQIELLMKIMDFQGIRHPIIVSNLTGFIVAGHARLEAAIALDLKDFPVDFQNFDDEAMEFAFLVSDNAIQELANLDRGLINQFMPKHGPELNVEMLAIPKFQIDMNEFKEPAKKPDALGYQCPDCGCKFVP